MIGRLQRIKDLRLDRAEQQLTAQQARVQLARVRQREAEQESLDYRQWRLAEEERLFA
ncbi:MAG: type III secretion system stalk subunit SctO, partial [Aeromonas veronii]